MLLEPVNLTFAPLLVATPDKSYVVLVLVSLLANVILSPDLEIVRPVPASKTISSTLLPLPPAVNLILSSSELAPSIQEIEYVVLVLVSIEARSIV